MKINKLKAFFIIVFIAILIPLSAINQPIINSSALIPPIEIYPPKKSPESFGFDYHNTCGEGKSTLLFATKESSYHIIFTNETSTTLATFDQDLYKTSEVSLIETPCQDAYIIENKIYLIDNQNLYIIDENQTHTETLPIKNAYKIEYINDELIVFCKGEFFVSHFDYGKIISCEYIFLNNFDQYYIFENNNEILITDFTKKLYFETTDFINAKVINSSLYFAVKNETEVVITKLENFAISHTTIISADAEFIDFAPQDTGIDIFVTTDKTYRYFICNHGDIISSSLFSDKRYIDIENNTYANNSYVYITNKEQKYALLSDFYKNKHYILDNIIFLEFPEKLVNCEKSNIYIAKLKNL